MAVRRNRKTFRAVATGMAIGVTMFATAVPASAQGIFEAIFGGLHHIVRQAPSLPADMHAFADPLSNTVDNATPSHAETGPATAYCVRTCDGHYFSVQANAGASAAEMCHAFCPASATRLYSGSGIDQAIGSDGSRYSDLTNAFVYRQHLVAGCTCNGRDAFGLAHIDAATDPTLRPGDIVATKTGLAAVASTHNRTAEFTPIQSYRGLSQSTRDKLADTKIMPANPGAPQVTPVKLPLAAAWQSDENRSALLTR
jgi:hypothetical protein